MTVRLDKPLSIWGEFREELESDRVTRGKLGYDPVGGLELELVEHPSKTKSVVTPYTPCSPNLYGQLVDGTLVTLTGCFIRRASYGSGLSGPAIVSANRAVLGCNTMEPDALPLKTYSVELSSLANWACGPSPKCTFVRTDGELIGLDASWRWPAPILVHLPEKPFDVEIRHVCNSHFELGCVSVAWTASAAILARNPLSLQEMQSHSWQLRNLITLLIGQQLSDRSTTLTPTKGDGPRQLEISVLYAQRSRHDWPDVSPSQVLVPYDSIRNQFPTIVRDWFSRSDQAMLATDFFFGSQLAKSPSVDIRFLELIHAAESYGRSLGRSMYMNPDEYVRMIQTLIDAIPPEIGDDHRNSLRNRLRYGNGYSLRKQLTQMLDRLPKDVNAQIVGDHHDKNKFIGKVVDTRNYYTHLDYESKSNAADGMEINVLAERVRILVVASLLLDMGIDRTTLGQILLRNPEFGHWMSVPSAW